MSKEQEVKKIEQPIPIWAWISADVDPESTLPLEERVCCALVGLPDLPKPEVHLFDILSFSYDPDAIADALLKKRIIAAFIDPEHYPRFIYSWNEKVNEIFLNKPQRRGKLPSMYKPIPERDKNQMTRYLSAMQKHLNNKTFTIAEHIQEDTEVRDQVAAGGRSLRSDATAGGVMIATQQYPMFKATLHLQERARNTKETWHGMTRIDS